MTNKSEFDDPLESIDPIMEQAFSIGKEEDGEESEIAEISTFLDNKVPEVAKEEPVAQKKEAPKAQEIPGTVPEHHSESTISSTELDLALDSEEEKDAIDESFELESDFDLPDSISTDVSQLEFPELDNEDTGGLKIQDGLFSNIPVRVSVELGRSKLSLKDVYELSEGAIVELERLVGEPLDLVINDQIIAQGEVVAIDNKYGLRIKNLVSSAKKR